MLINALFIIKNKLQFSNYFKLSPPNVWIEDFRDEADIPNNIIDINGEIADKMAQQI